MFNSDSKNSLEYFFFFNHQRRPWCSCDKWKHPHYVSVTMINCHWSQRSNFVIIRISSFRFHSTSIIIPMQTKTRLIQIVLKYWWVSVDCCIQRREYVSILRSEIPIEQICRQMKTIKLETDANNNDVAIRIITKIIKGTSWSHWWRMKGPIFFNLG